MLSRSGLHQPSEWQKARFRGAVQATVSASRLRRLGGSSSDLSGAESDDVLGGHGRADVDDEAAGRRRAETKEAKELAKRRLESSHMEGRTLITTILSALDPSFLDRSPGSVNELSRKGILFVTACSTVGFHVVRLLIRDALFDAIVTRSGNRTKAILKRRITEVYLLSSLHSIGCSIFSLRKFLTGNWDNPRGAEGMLCFSLGYTTYSVLVLRKSLINDPMFAINEIANLVKLVSCLRSRGVRWIVPLLFSAEIPLASLSVLRMMAELGTGRSSWPFQLALGAFTTSFAIIKGVVLPGAIVSLIVRRAKDFPELHQPSFLPAKLAIIARIFLNYTWLSVVATHWRPRRPRMGAASGQSQRAPRVTDIEELPRLSDLTSNTRSALNALRSWCNPFSVLYFIFFQSVYFIGPLALPAMIWSLIRRPKLRLAAGSGLFALALATFWPMKVDEPFHKDKLEFAPFKVLGDMVRAYLYFKSVYEEPLQKDRRYLLAVLPHGVMPYCVNCLMSEQWEQGFLPNMLGASVLLKIPFLRQFFRFGGVLPAKKAIVDKALRWSYPNNVTFIIPGGIAEIFFMRPDIEQIFIKKRKGFVKLALQAGTDLVPVYGLGHTHLFTTLDRSRWLGRMMMQLSRKLRVSLPLSYGRWGMPLIPYRKQVIALVGRPIRIDQAIPNPTEEQINEVHAKFCVELRRIFDKHKHLIEGYENKRLYFEDEEVPPQRPNSITSDYLFPSTLPALSSKL